MCNHAQIMGGKNNCTLFGLGEGRCYLGNFENNLGVVPNTGGLEIVIYWNKGTFKLLK